MTVQPEAADRLIREIIRSADLHQFDTLNDAKKRVLVAVHHLNKPCTDSELSVALAWTRQYVYRLADELAAQGVLIRLPALRTSGPGRPSLQYRCVCSIDPEGV